MAQYTVWLVVQTEEAIEVEADSPREAEELARQFILDEIVEVTDVQEWTE